MRLFISVVTFASVAILLFVAKLFVPEPWFYFLRFVAIVPAVWVYSEALQTLKRLDELQQRILLEALTFSLANTLLLMFLGWVIQISAPWDVLKDVVLISFLAFLGFGFWRARRRYLYQ